MQRMPRPRFVLIRGICYGGVNHAVLAWSSGILVTQTESKIEPILLARADEVVE